VPVEDHARVRPPADPPRTSLQSPSHAFTRPAWYSPPKHAVCRFFTGYPGLVGSVPPTISALTALTLMCVPFARPGSPPTRRLRRSASAAGCAWAVHLRCGRMPPLCAIRHLAKNGFTGPILASITALTRLVVLCAAPPPVRSFGRLARAQWARCGAGTSSRTASPAACRRRSPR
jgi:hypothetical protein